MVFSELRAHFDGKELFVAGGSGVRGAPRSSWMRRVKNNPEWAMNDVEVQKILLRAFPKMDRNKKQRERAGRWSRIIQLFYRSAYPGGKVAELMGISEKTVYDTILRIKRVAKGLRSTGKSRTGKRGRPKSIRF